MIASLRGYGRLAMGADGKVYAANCPPGSAWNPHARRCQMIPRRTGGSGVIAVGYNGIIMDNAGSAGSSLRGFRGYGDANQDNWCNQNYPDATNNAKCKQGWDLFKCPACVSPPWTAEGKLARGLTDIMGAAAQVISGSGSSSSSSPPPPAGGAGGGAAGAKGGGKAAAGATILGVPKTVALVGGGLLALGVVAVAMKRMKRRR